LKFFPKSTTSYPTISLFVRSLLHNSLPLLVHLSSPCLTQFRKSPFSPSFPPPLDTIPFSARPFLTPWASLSGQGGFSPPILPQLPPPFSSPRGTNVCCCVVRLREPPSSPRPFFFFNSDSNASPPISFFSSYFPPLPLPQVL